MRIIDYMPNLYTTNAHMNTIYNSMDNEFETHIKSNINQTYLNTFVKSADINGIENFENIFNIVADPDNETLEFRRERILYRLNSQLPYTYRYLESKLNEIMGEGNWEMTLTYNDYHLVIAMTIPGRSWYDELVNLLETIIPCNIEYEIQIYAASWDQVKNNFSVWGDISSMTWQDVLDGLWLDI